MLVLDWMSLTMTPERLYWMPSRQMLFRAWMAAWVISIVSLVGTRRETVAELDSFDELQDKLQTCIGALNSLSSKIGSQQTDNLDVEKFKADVAVAAKSAVEDLLDDRQKQREEKDKNDKEKYGITQDEYMGSLSERYDIVLSRCEGLLNIIEKGGVISKPLRLYLFTYQGKLSGSFFS